MDILYTTKTNLTYEEYLRMYNFSRKSPRRTMIIVLIIEALCLVPMNFSGFEPKSFAILAIMALIIGMEFYTSKVAPKKYYDKLKKGKDLTFDFYADRMIQSSDNGKVVLKYDEIYKLYETKTNFYILISAREVFIIVKENCSEELCEFIRGKK